MGIEVAVNFCGVAIPLGVRGGGKALLQLISATIRHDLYHASRAVCVCLTAAAGQIDIDTIAVSSA